MDYCVIDEMVFNWWGRFVQKLGENFIYGGFYIQEDIKEIIVYVKECFIEVIFEVDMLGYVQVIIVVYFEIGCVNKVFYVVIGGVFKNNIYNFGKEVMFEFVEKMFNEVMDLFFFDYVYIGGDECNKE